MLSVVLPVRASQRLHMRSVCHFPCMFSKGQFVMVCTNDIIESFLHCRYKSYLKCCGKQGVKTNFEKLQKRLRRHMFSTLSQKITTKGKIAVFPHTPVTSQLLREGADFILNIDVLDQLCHFALCCKKNMPSGFLIHI